MRIQSAASASEYPFALIAAGMESLVTGFGSQKEEGRLLGAGIYRTLYSFLFVDISSVEIKLSHANKEVPKKGKQTIVVKRHYASRHKTTRNTISRGIRNAGA